MIVKYVAVSTIIFVVNHLAISMAALNFPSMGFDKLRQLPFFRNKEPVIKSLSEITLEKNVWKVAPLKQGNESPISKVTMATTEEGYTLSCVPAGEGRQQCATLAEVVGKDSLHYVELLRYEGGSLLESFCTSDLDDITNHIQHVCDYRSCTETTCSILFVFDMRVALEVTPTEVEMCTTVAISVEVTGPVIKKSSNCDTGSQNPDEKSVLQECKKKQLKIPSSSQKLWSKKDDLQSLCTVVDEKDP